MIEKERIRQQKLFEATASAKAQTSLAQKGQNQFVIASTQGDLGDEVQRQLFDTFVDNEKVEALRATEGSNGAKLSPEAKARLEISLGEISSALKSRAAKSHLMAMQQTGIDILSRSLNAAANLAGRDPSTLEVQLEQFEAVVDEFSGAFSTNLERDLRTKGREQIIESGLLGTVNLGFADGARQRLASGEFDKDLTPAAVKRINAQIDRKEREGLQVERAKVADLVKADPASIAATGVPVEGLSEDRVHAAAGGGKPGEFAVQQFREARQRAATAHQVQQDFRSATPDQMSAIAAAAAPSPGDPNFNDKAQTARVVEAERDRQLKLRQDDPATAVMGIPQVAAGFDAISGSLQDPDFAPTAEFVAALRQRFAVQKQIGVTQPRLLTRAEVGFLGSD